MQQSKPLNVATCVIATRKYKQFVYNLICGIGKNFLPEHNRTVFLFTDEIIPMESAIPNLRVVQQKILPYPFPFATLYRYKVITNNAHLFDGMDYVAYTDADMDFVGLVDETVLNDGLTFVYHPGFYSKKDTIGHWGSNGVVKESLAYIEPELRTGYVAGGFNLGTKDEFLKMSKILSQRIEEDEKRGVMATYHDESHLNWYIKKYPENIKYLDPSYCLVEQKHLREAWGISNLPERIIALSKNHNEIRS